MLKLILKDFLIYMTIETVGLTVVNEYNKKIARGSFELLLF